MAKYTSKRASTNKTNVDIKPSSLELRIKILEESLINTQTKLKILQDQIKLINGWIKIQFGIDLISSTESPPQLIKSTADKSSPQLMDNQTVNGKATKRKHKSSSKSTTAALAPMKIKTEPGNNLIRQDDSDQDTEPLSMSQLMDISSQGSLKPQTNRIDTNTTTTTTTGQLQGGAAAGRHSKKTTDKRQGKGKDNVHDQDQLESNPPPAPANTKKPKKSTIMSCELCKKSFSSNCTLIKHKQAVHANNGHQKRSNKKSKDHKCGSCSASYVHKNHLNRHIRDKHTPEGQRSSYTCKICKMKLCSKISLKCHMKIHNPKRKKEYECKICTTYYYNKQSLGRHIINRHHSTSSSSSSK